MAVLIHIADHLPVGHRLAAHLLRQLRYVLAQRGARRVNLHIVDEVGLRLQGHLWFDGDASFAARSLFPIDGVLN